ncbi:MAG: pilus assembly protein [Planctomycetaceae bacterium]|nr:pilus assembly protein [Planctomycetaceae bacterium]
MISTSITSPHPTRVTANRRGAVTVEFALVLPIILLVFLAALELTAANIIRHSASNAAYEAARRMIIPGASREAAQQEARSILQMTGCQNGADVAIENVGRQVRVTVSVPASQNSWGLTRFVGNLVIRQTVLLSREEPD